MSTADDSIKCPTCNRDVPSEPARHGHDFAIAACPMHGRALVRLRPAPGGLLPTPSVPGPTTPIPPLPWELTPPPGMVRIDKAIGQAIACPDCGGVATVGTVRGSTASQAPSHAYVATECQRCGKRLVPAFEPVQVIEPQTAEPPR